MKKDKSISKIYGILLVYVVLLAAAGYFAYYAYSQNVLRNDMQCRADEVREHIVEVVDVNDLICLNENSQEGELARNRLQEKLNGISDISTLKRLYIATVNDNNEVITTLKIPLSGGEQAMYIPTDKIESDLRRSLEEGVCILGGGVYNSYDDDRVYTIFWPVLDENQQELGTVCMEFET